MHNSQKVEITQISINRWIDKQNICNEILISLKKEGNPDRYYKMDKWNKPETKLD